MTTKLIDRAKSGDQFAFTCLFQEKRDKVYGFIRSIVKNATECEDLTMITFEKAFSKINTYTSTGEFDSWLFEIAKNTAYDHLKKKKLIYYDDSKNEVETPQQRLLSKEMGDILDKSIAKLYKNYIDIIELRFQKGLSYDEICSNLNITNNVARVHLCHARKRLYEIFTKNYIL